MKNNTKFIKFVKEECEKHEVKCNLVPTKHIDYSGDIKCGGWFDGYEKELAVAMKHKDSMSLLVHEYSHMTQWIDDIDVWKKCMDEESHDKVDKWISGEYVDNINYYIDNCRDLELDNEKRAVKLIRKFNLEIDIDIYIKKANAYVQFYNYIKLSRKWSVPKNSPYNNDRIMNNCPNKFTMDYSKISRKLEKIFREENIGFPKNKKIK